MEVGSTCWPPTLQSWPYKVDDPTTGRLNERENGRVGGGWEEDLGGRGCTVGGKEEGGRVTVDSCNEW